MSNMIDTFGLRCAACGHFGYDHGDFFDKNKGPCSHFPMGRPWDYCRCTKFKEDNLTYLENLI